MTGAIPKKKPAKERKRKAEGNRGDEIRPGAGSRMRRAVSDAAGGRPRSPRVCDMCDGWLEGNGVAVPLQQCAAGSGMWICNNCGEPIRVRVRRQRPDGSFSRWHRWKFAQWGSLVDGGGRALIRVCDEVGGHTECEDKLGALEVALQGGCVEIKRSFMFFTSDEDND